MKNARELLITILLVAVGILVWREFTREDQSSALRVLEEDKVLLQQRADSLERGWREARLQTLQAYTEKAKTDQALLNITLRNQNLIHQHERLLKSRSPHLPDSAIHRAWAELYNH